MDILRAKYLNLQATPQFKKGEDLADLKYDCVIYGSDQIWWRHSPFPTYPGFDPVFWGEYIPSSSKKIAYAASMGQMDIDSHDKDFIKNALVHFNYISVREEGLRQLLQPLTSKNILTAVDPTLLMGIDFWKIRRCIYSQRKIRTFIQFESFQSSRTTGSKKGTTIELPLHRNHRSGESVKNR
jgi:hypothetical protein